MTTMILEIYDALKAAGAPDDKAKAAARAFGDQSALAKSDIIRIEKELIIIKWMLAIVIAAVVLPLFKAFF